MKLEKSVERQTKNTIEYYKNLDNLEEAPIDILRAMYKDLLQELRKSIPKKKIEDKIEELENCKMDIVQSPVHNVNEKMKILDRNMIKREVL